MARIQDAVDLCDKRHKPQFIGFLDEKEQLYTEKITSQMGFKNYMFWGGHTSSERVVLVRFGLYRAKRQPFSDSDHNSNLSNM